MMSSRSSRGSHPAPTAASPLTITSWSLNSPPPPHHNHCDGCQDDVEEMRGFKIFLIVTQVLMLLVVFTSVLTAYILDSPAYLPMTIFAYVEVVIFVIALIHACRPSIRMLLFFVALEIANALAMISLGLVVAIKDGDCSPSANSCGFFNLTVDERFYLFWFLLTKATFDLFLGLIAVAHSPQMHDYMAGEDDWEQRMFQG